jgi:predicted Zn-dependent protease
VERGVLRAQVHDGRVFELPLDRLELDLGGASGRMLYCRTRQPTVTVCSEDPRLPHHLRAGAPGVLDVPLAALAARERRSARWNRVALVVAALVLALLVYGVWWIPARGVPRAVDALPPSVDRQLGDAAIEQLTRDARVVHAPPLDAALGEIVERLAEHAAVPGFTYRFRVIERDEVNAFALPGGQIVIFTGLLRRANGPEQVAGVLAHEIAHVTFRHGLRGLARSAGIWVGVQLLLGDTSGLAALVTAGAAQAMISGYSRKQEREADEEGARMMAAAGLDPHALPQFFAVLQHEGREIPGALSWLASHPATTDRIADLERLIPTLPAAPRRPLTADWTAALAALP